MHLEKSYILNYLNGQIEALESIKEPLASDPVTSIIDIKIDTLKDIVRVVKEAPVPFDLI